MAQIYRVILPVSCIEKATKFYQTVFHSEGERVSQGRHYFDCGGVILACYDPVADGDEKKSVSLWQHHENQYIYFAVKNLAAYQDRVLQADGKLLSEIESMPWGETLFYAQDPFGSRLCFVDETTLFKGQ